MTVVTLGIDLGKNVCSVAGLDAVGSVIMTQRVRRDRLLSFLTALEPCVVAMEACGGAHHVARFCQELGHEPRLMSPLYVRPYVKVHKTDDRDAEGIAEAATRPTMSFVAVKTAGQLDLQALHRARERLIHNRTRLINQARAFLMERGLRIGQGRHVFQRALQNIDMTGDADIGPRIQELIRDMATELDELNKRIAAFDTEIKELARNDPDMKRLTEIPGIGPMIASALVAAVGEGQAFAKGRDLSAWLGLVPRQISTGGKAKLIGISKRGNPYLRKLFIHGARTVLHLVKDRSSPLTRWIDQLKLRCHDNVAVVAMANKLARIAWAVLTKRERFNQAALLGVRTTADGGSQRDLRVKERWTNDRSAFCKSGVGQWPSSAGDLMRHRARDFPILVGTVQTIHVPIKDRIHRSRVSGHLKKHLQGGAVHTLPPELPPF